MFSYPAKLTITSCNANATPAPATPNATPMLPILSLYKNSKMITISKHDIIHKCKAFALVKTCDPSVDKIAFWVEAINRIKI